jgi:hypothetical protein
VQGGHGRQRGVGRRDDRAVSQAPQLLDQPVCSHPQLDATAEGSHHLPVGRHLGVRSPGAEAAALAVNDVRSDSPLGLVPDTQPLTCVAHEAVNEDVGFGQQPEEHLAAGLRAQVGRHTAFPPIDVEVRRAVVGSDLPEEVAQIVTDARGFHLDDVRTEIGQDPARLIAIEQYGALENPDSFQQFDHVIPSSQALGNLLGPYGKAPDLAVAVQGGVVDRPQPELALVLHPRLELIDTIVALLDIAGDPDGGCDLGKKTFVEGSDLISTMELLAVGTEKQGVAGEQVAQFGVGAAIDGIDVSVGEVTGGAGAHIPSVAHSRALFGIQPAAMTAPALV